MFGLSQLYAWIVIFVASTMFHICRAACDTSGQSIVTSTDLTVNLVLGISSVYELPSGKLTHRPWKMPQFFLANTPKNWCMLARNDTSPPSQLYPHFLKTISPDPPGTTMIFPPKISSCTYISWQGKTWQRDVVTGHQAMTTTGGGTVKNWWGCTRLLAIPISTGIYYEISDISGFRWHEIWSKFIKIVLAPDFSTLRDLSNIFRDTPRRHRIP